jgi:ABC-type transport system substrate-binding protein
MHRRLTLSLVSLVLGAALLAASSTASPAAPSATAAPSGPAQTGGTFRFSLDTDIDYVDPALAYYI